MYSKRLNTPALINVEALLFMLSCGKHPAWRGARVVLLLVLLL